MGTERLTAFSDGVIAVIITIMVLELKPPAGASLEALRPMLPGVLSYVLSFTYIAIYWNNHHHLFQAARRVDGLILWANMNLLFWLSLIPLATAWQGAHFLSPFPTLVYGVLLFMAGLSYYLLEKAILRRQKDHAHLAEALAANFKDNASVGLYFISIVAAPYLPALSVAIFVLVAAIWLVPDRRLERLLDDLAK